MPASWRPAVVERLGLPPRTAAIELNLDALPERQPPVAPVISPYPPVHLDVALVVDAVDPGGRRRPGRCATAAVNCWSPSGCSTSTPATRSAPGSKSLAFALVVRAPDRTLTAADATAVRDAAVAVAAERVGAALRG